MWIIIVSLFYKIKNLQCAISLIKEKFTHFFILLYLLITVHFFIYYVFYLLQKYLLQSFLFDK